VQGRTAAETDPRPAEDHSWSLAAGLASHHQDTETALRRVPPCEPQRYVAWFPQRYVARRPGSVLDGRVPGLAGSGSSADRGTERQPLDDAPRGRCLRTGNKEGLSDAGGQREARLHRSLGGLEGGQVCQSSLRDRQVWDDVFMGPTVGRVLREGPPHRSGELPERNLSSRMRHVVFMRSVRPPRWVG